MFEKYWDRDTWLVQQQTKIILCVFGLFFVSMVMSCQELRYMVSGKVVDAGGSPRVETWVDKYGTKTQHQVISYQFQDGEATRGQTLEVPLNWTNPSPGNSLKVQYIPGSDTSRLLGQSNRVWVWVFFVSLALSIFGGWIMVKSG